MNALFGKLYFKLPNSQRLERIWKIAHVDFIHRYYNSRLGLVWALINPLFRIAIYYFVFTLLLNHRVENFAFYLFSGLILWIFFQECTTKCLNILRSKRYLLDTIQFNKLDLFYSAGISILLGLLFNTSVYIICALLFKIQLSILVFIALILILNLFILGVGIGILLATINIYFKDIQHVWSLSSFALFWTCPIFFEEDLLVSNFPFILYLNPVSGIIMNMRNVLLTNEMPDLFWLCFNFIYGVIFLFLATVIFNKFSDKVLEYN